MFLGARRPLGDGVAGLVGKRAGCSQALQLVRAKGRKLAASLGRGRDFGPEQSKFPEAPK